jgi:hypothetical protein
MDTRNSQEILKALLQEKIEAVVNENLREFNDRWDSKRLTIMGIEEIWGVMKGGIAKKVDEFYQEVVNQLPEKEAAVKKKNELASQCVRIRNAGKQKRAIATTSGIININRTVFSIMEDLSEIPPDIADRVMYCEELAAAEEEKRHLVIPLDEVLRIDRLPYKMTPAMMKEVSDEGTDSKSFEAAARSIKKHYGMEVSESQIQKITYYTGELVDKDDEEKAEEIDKNWTEADIPEEAEIEGILDISADGSMVPILGENGGAAWMENELGEVWSEENTRSIKPRKPDGEERGEILQKEYATSLGNFEAFKKRLFECALRNGYGRYKTTVFISDGAAKLEKLCDDYFPDAVKILDFYHFAENIYAFARYKFKNDAAKYRPWAEELISLAWNSETEELLKRLKPYKNRKPPQGVPRIWHYVHGNRGRIDYKTYRELGYITGSGAMESSQKSVIQRRCKGPGMRWKKENAHRVITLCAKNESDLGHTILPLLEAACT